MKRLKQEKGSITLFVLIAMLFFVMYLVGMYILNANSESSQLAATKRIKEIYEKDVNNIDDVYATLEDSIKPGKVEKTKDNINYVTDGEKGTVPVPVEFEYLEGTKSDGFVIKNKTDNNEFVWIPVDIIDGGYGTKNWNKGQAPTSYIEYYTSDSIENNKIIEDITKSVNDYKGYYIGRYEAGILNERTVNGEAPMKPISRKTSTENPVYAYNYVEWNQSIVLANRLYSKNINNVQSRLINARSWDTALKFIEQKDSTYPINSSDKGWYSNNKGNNTKYETGKSTDLTNVTIPNKLKNIYDMAGNMYEWTADKYNLQANCVNARGGYYDNTGISNPVSYYDYGYNNQGYSYMGFRVVLYL